MKMRPKPVLRHLLLAVLVLSASQLIACDGPPTRGGALSNLSSEQKRELESKVASLTADVGFKVLPPAYVPEGLPWLPFTQKVGMGRHPKAMLFYWAIDRSPKDVPYIMQLWITENPAEPGDTCPPCPCDDPAQFQHVGIEGVVAALESSGTSKQGIGETLSLYAGELYIRVTVDWELPSADSKLSDEMHEELLKVTRSLIKAAKEAE